MFALKIVDSDAFIDMPDSAQNLYFHLAMRADDDGFISNPKKIMRMIGANDDNLKILLSKRFLLAFDTGIVVIKHWRLHNYIAKDRYNETVYKEEKERLFVKANGAYTDHPEIVYEAYTPCIQNDDTGKVSKGKVSKVEDDTAVSVFPHSPEHEPATPPKPKKERAIFKKPTLEEVAAYCKERKNSVNAQTWFDYYEANGWKVGRNAMKDWQASIRYWEKNSFASGKQYGQRPRIAADAETGGEW